MTHRVRSCLVMFAGMLLVTGSTPLAAETIVVESDVAVDHVPVTVNVPAALADSAVLLVQHDTGKSTPVQKDLSGGNPALTFVVDHLDAGEAKRFKVVNNAKRLEGRGVKLKKSDQGMEVWIDGEYFTTYLIDSGPKPYCYPVIGPTGKPVTRDYPMKEGTSGERYDHKHHRSFWFTFDKVNGHDFWSESDRAGKSVHRKFTDVVSGPVFGEFKSHVDWMSKAGKKVCEDQRTMRIYRVPGARLFDSRICLRASEDDLTFGDSKEGLFAFRVAGTMKVDQSRNEDKSQPAGGTLFNANGQKNQQTWGKRAKWCDYYGPVGSDVVGIAIFDHPSNFRHPTYWHSRTYGLFAANPFGLSYFTGDKGQDGSHTIRSGQELCFRYRVYIHKGDSVSAEVEDQYAVYANPLAARLE